MAKYFLLLLAAVWSVQGQQTSDQGPATRVVGGTDAPDGAVPHQVSVRRISKNGNHACGGAIISERWILIKSSDFFAVVGSNLLSEGGTRYEIKKIIIHEKYNVVPLANDIGILLTKEKIEYTDKIKPIALASRAPKDGATCLMTGWGFTDKNSKQKTDKLQWLNVTVLSVPKCQKTFKQIRAQQFYRDKQLCTLPKNGKGFCQGDDGGVLVEQNEAVGILSFNKSCAKGVLPDVSAPVFRYLGWINKKIEANKDE